ncbi:MAG: hypothetical protein WCT54_03540 [Patescibacteria group bacterium]
MVLLAYSLMHQEIVWLTYAIGSVEFINFVVLFWGHSVSLDLYWERCERHRRKMREKSSSP